MRWGRALSLVAAVGTLAADWIVSGVAWYDTDGKKIDAHGGAVVRRGDTFFWVGYRANGMVVERPSQHITKPF